jgi:hypothetical protein
MLFLVTISNGPQCGNVYERGEGANPKQVSYYAGSLRTVRSGEKHAGENKGHNKEAPRFHYRFVLSFVNNVSNLF